ncbi:MAG: mercury methylation ferredoxin HgcB [Bacteroidota bacterium]|nr:mercury methylation ferredoxin HgcB [Bacteroidota bacterium]
MKTMQYLKNVVTLKLNADLCTGCGMCVLVCPHAVFGIANGKARILDIDDCMECGACSNNCRTGAIYVKAGVGCAAGIINGILNGTEPSCDCTKGNKSNCC